MIGVGAFVGRAGSRIAFGRAGAHLTRRLRTMAFAAYMQQEIGYFDMPGNSLGVITSRLAQDSGNVCAMITDAWGDMAQLAAVIITGLTISFIYAPNITGIVLLMAPFQIWGSFTRAKAIRGFEDATKKAYEESSEVAAEAIKDVRTVASLTRQQYFVEKFSGKEFDSVAQTFARMKS